jgi:hypothetical protein
MTLPQQYIADIINELKNEGAFLTSEMQDDFDTYLSADHWDEGEDYSQTSAEEWLGWFKDEFKEWNIDEGDYARDSYAESLAESRVDRGEYNRRMSQRDAMCRTL